MTALALILQDMGKKVSGSDLSHVYATDRLLQQKQIKPLIGFHPKNLGSADAVIYSASHQGSYNVEVMAAKKQKLACFNLAQAIGSLTQQKKTVAVSGCHGKTTTTALISYCLIKAKKNPSYLVGSAGFMNLPSGAYSSGEWRLLTLQASRDGVDSGQCDDRDGGARGVCQPVHRVDRAQRDERLVDLVGDRVGRGERERGKVRTRAVARVAKGE